MKRDSRPYAERREKIKLNVYEIHRTGRFNELIKENDLPSKLKRIELAKACIKFRIKAREILVRNTQSA